MTLTYTCNGQTVARAHPSLASLHSPLQSCNPALSQVLIDKLLPKLRNEGRKVLIFSQFKMVLDILVRYFNGRG